MRAPGPSFGEAVVDPNRVQPRMNSSGLQSSNNTETAVTSVLGGSDNEG
jgi:hypothetical protein